MLVGTNAVGTLECLVLASALRRAFTLIDIYCCVFKAFMYKCSVISILHTAQVYITCVQWRPQGDPRFSILGLASLYKFVTPGLNSTEGKRICFESEKEVKFLALTRINVLSSAWPPRSRQLAPPPLCFVALCL